MRLSRLLACDPGSERSALLQYDLETDRPLTGQLIPNEELVAALRDCDWAEAGVIGLAIEDTKAFTLPGGARGRFFPEQVRITARWVGAFVEAVWPLPHQLIDRREVRRHLAGSSAAGDAHIRAALLDRFGPGRETAVGKKRSPGPLYGIKRDLWAALAVAVTYRDLHWRVPPPTLRH